MQAKISFLKSKNIALWDVIQVCQRPDSSDSKIVNPIINDFVTFLAQYPNIKAILFNGKEAERLLTKYGKNKKALDLQLITLPSSIPVNAGISLDKKMKTWSFIKDLVNN